MSPEATSQLLRFLRNFVQLSSQLAALPVACLQRDKCMRPEWCPGCKFPNAWVDVLNYSQFLYVPIVLGKVDFSLPFAGWFEGPPMNRCSITSLCACMVSCFRQSGSAPSLENPFHWSYWNVIRYHPSISQLLHSGPWELDRKPWTHSRNGSWSFTRNLALDVMCTWDTLTSELRS